MSTIRTTVLFLTILLFLLLFSISTSPLFPCADMDSNIFQQIGLGILQGKVPYTELFDHKGPMLFYIDALGLWINRSWGILLLQVLSLSVTLHFGEKILKLYHVTGITKLVCIKCTFLALFAYLSEGNLSEEWSLPFIALPIYWCVKAIEKKSGILSTKELLGIGLCLGCISFIRLNNMAPALGYLIYVCFLHVNARNYGYVGKSFGLILGGILLIAFSWIAVFYHLGGIQSVLDMLYGTFTFNWEYMKFQASEGELSLLFKLLSYGPILVLAAITALNIKKTPKRSIPLLLALGIGLLSIGNTLFRHYFLVFIPLLPLVWVLLEELKYKRLISTGIIVMFLGMCINPLIRYIENPLLGKDKLLRTQQQQFIQIVKTLPETDRDSIWNFNGRYLIHDLNAAGIVQCNRIMVPRHLEISESLLLETKAQVSREKPLYILVDEDYYYPDWEDWNFIQSHYTTIASTQIEGLHNATLLKRK